MSEKFTASNGMQIAWMPDDRGIKVLQANAECVKYCLPESGWRVVGDTTGASGNPGFTEDSALAVALREFFLHERDQELGRWRWPENPEYVAYDLGVRVVRITHEPTGNSWDLDEFSLPNHIVGGRQSWHRTAQDYFAAHPLPKPWHDAKPGEVWVLTDSEDTKPAFVTDGGRFELEIGYCDLDCEDIIDAKRVWPEAVES